MEKTDTKGLAPITQENASLFMFCAGCYVLGKMGLKFDFLNDTDKINIKQLHRRIKHNV